MRTGSTPRGLGVRERQSPGAGPLPLLHVAHLTASGRGGPRMRDGSWSFTDKWPGCQHPDRWAHTGPQARVGTSGFHLCVLADARAQQGVLGTCGVPRPPIPSSSRQRCPESKTKPWLPGSPQRMGREQDGHREARGTRPRHRSLCLTWRLESETPTSCLLCDAVPDHLVPGRAHGAGDSQPRALARPPLQVTQEPEAEAGRAGRPRSTVLETLRR